MENDVEWVISVLFFFNDTATTEIYTLSLHDALPIYRRAVPASGTAAARRPGPAGTRNSRPGWRAPARTAEPARGSVASPLRARPWAGGQPSRRRPPPRPASSAPAQSSGPTFRGSRAGDRATT